MTFGVKHQIIRAAGLLMQSRSQLKGKNCSFSLMNPCFCNAIYETEMKQKLLLPCGGTNRHGCSGVAV